jgi:large subunit ribosomal protein L35
MKGNTSMPKFKPHSGMKKRVKITGRGKILAEPAGKRHLLEVKPSKRTRRLSGNVELSHAESRRVKKLLGL